MSVYILPGQYYNLSPYDAYLYGNRELVTIHNNLLRDGRKILLIKDSFANVVAPFLSIGIENLDIVDLRYFTGSIKSYIEKHIPDTVVIMYNPSVIHAEKMFHF
jgi:hypothetical protein